MLRVLPPPGGHPADHGSDRGPEMTSYSSAKEEIKAAADIVELIGQFVQLRKAGRNFVGLCPFHAEKDPSFTVNQERQTFHCFGCKAGGDIFSFWMAYHSCTFPEALRDLAERYHVTLSDGFSAAREKERTSRKEALFRINERAAAYFRQSLRHTTKGKAARAYLEKRALTAETIEAFGLGFAPDEWDGLVGALQRDGLAPDLASEAGLVVPRKTGGGYYDRFRGRIIFPIFDLRRRIVGFGGRVLDDSLPKYLNTPETLLFHKGDLLYGLHAAREAIRKRGRAVIVEGYMDCLALRNHGLENVVATLGTALTASHVRRLKGYAKEAVVVFDSDAAGMSAVLKSLPVFSNEGLPARAAVLPEGDDPDTFVNRTGLDAFIDFLDGARSMFDFFMDRKLSEGDSDEAKAHALNEIFPILSDVRDFALRSLYVRRLSERTGIREEVVLSGLAAFSKNPAGKGGGGPIADHVSRIRTGKNLRDLQLLNLLVHYPETVPRLMACDCRVLLRDPVVREITDTLFDACAQKRSVDTGILLDRLQTEAARERLREVLLRPFVFSKEEIEQAVVELEEEVYQAGIAASFQKAREAGDLEQLVKLTKLKGKGPLRGGGERL